MKRVLIAGVLCIGAVSFPRGSIMSLAASGNCKDVPLRVTIYNNAVTDPSTGTTSPSAILSDGGGEYINGTSASVTIKVWDGTNDAVVNVSSSKRTFQFVFPSPAPGSVIQSFPTWVPG